MMRDLALVVGAALALAEDDLDVGVVVVALLHRVDHRVVEVHRELRDEADLDELAGGRAWPRSPADAVVAEPPPLAAVVPLEPLLSLPQLAARTTATRATATNRLVLMLSPLGF